MNITGFFRDLLFGKPNCPMCKSGRLHKKEDVIDIKYLKGGFHYYGIVLPDKEIKKMRETTYCDKCNYQNVREYEAESD
jgi:C4-type Zn-finger protein